ncbi:MAG: AAA family ATPase [Bacteroidota bacterium]
MSYQLDIPFLAVRMRLSGGGTMMSPLFDGQSIRINESMELMEGRYAETFQRLILNKGNYRELLNVLQDGDYYKADLMVSFRASKDGISHPDFSIAFEYFFKPSSKGYWAMVPTLGIEAFAPSMEQLDRVIEENIRLDFTRKRRLAAMQFVIPTFWFSQIELRSKVMQLSIPNLGDLERLKEGKDESLLAKVARLLNIERKVTYGRKTELQQLARAVKGKFNRNVLVVGASGVGKTALIWELVRLRKSKRIQGQVWETTASAMIKELTADTGWQDNLAQLCQELAGSSDYLFVRNLLELFEVGQYVGNEVSMAEYLRAYISRGEISLLSECTEEELARIELRSPNYLSYFQVIRLEEPRKDLEDIILSKVNDLARNRQLQIDSEAVRETIRLNKRFTPYAGFPGKPIRFLESILMNVKPAAGKAIQREEVIGHFCEESGMPQFMVDPRIPMAPQEVKDRFNQQVFGQERAVESVVNLLASVKTALSKTGKPIASLLFVGPTGVGKTELAKVLAEFMFGSRNKMIRFDMSEYSDPYAVQRLTGEAFYKDGLLTAAVRREPFCVLLFDEIEKAHPSFYDLLLQMLSEGRLTDSKGHLVNFCSTIIIMTSNIGAANLQGNRIGWRKGLDVEAVTEHFMTAVQKHFRPEMYNRIDEVIPFEPLSRDTVRQVVDREISLFREREGIRFRPLDLYLPPELYDYLAEKGYDPRYGARQLQRSIREQLIIPLARQLNHLDYDEKLIVRASLDKDRIVFDIEDDPLGLDLLLEELDKINLSDHASELRRQLVRIQEGHYYIALLSQLDLLEREKQRLKRKFWEDTQKANSYSYILQTQKDVADLKARVEQYELELSMACLDLRPYNPALEEDLKKWKKDFFVLKQDIYTHTNPDENYCFLAIYGRSIDPVLQLYLSCFGQMEVLVTGFTVWYREKYYNEEVTEVQTTTDENGREYKTEIRRRRQEFIKKEYSTKDANWQVPPEKGDVLYGIELGLVAPAIYLRLREEAGLQRWVFGENVAQTYRIVTSKRVEYSPENLIRKEYYKGNPYRIYESGFLKDTRLKISREVSKRQYGDLLWPALEERFKIALDQALFIGEG